MRKYLLTINGVRWTPRFSLAASGCFSRSKAAPAIRIADHLRDQEVSTFADNTGQDDESIDLTGNSRDPPFRSIPVRGIRRDLIKIFLDIDQASTTKSMKDQGLEKTGMQNKTAVCTRVPSKALQRFSTHES